MEEIDFTPNARVRYLGETRGMCPEQHSALEFVAETIVQVAREAANGGIPYLEDPFAARSFVNRYRLQAGMDRITGHITDNSSVNSMPKKYLANEVSAGEQGQGPRNGASSHQRTSRGSRTHSSDDQSASDHPRGEGMRIRGIANEFSFGHERRELILHQARVFLAYSQ
ncbi:hypothetical protein P167DRAFT_574370 [Morchella conica CCBAS932]|uniref:Uncharacterized protein n=1 Tax=Morchella conica CCBAS932 TaxID=1392247 RepID=A0A3N4KVF1_9PEZI|nr:hypothetical protein P167DRAFT_574370 [Morchella conica CCBAS932]